jgi:hypothetical protein
MLMLPQVDSAFTDKARIEETPGIEAMWKRCV